MTLFATAASTLNRKCSRGWLAVPAHAAILPLIWASPAHAQVAATPLDGAIERTKPGEFLRPGSTLLVKRDSLRSGGPGHAWTVIVTVSN